MRKLLVGPSTRGKWKENSPLDSIPRWDSERRVQHLPRSRGAKRQRRRQQVTPKNDMGKLRLKINLTLVK